MTATPARAPSVPCRYCREPVAPGAERCPHCAEELRPPRTDLVRLAIAGFALGLFVLALVARLFDGPLADTAATARSLRFLEVVASACFLLLLARTVRGDPR